MEKVQIDENGAEVKAAEGAAPADPAGDGKATCSPVSIAMAGALNGPDAALGINIKNGVQLAIDQHNAANPGRQVQLKPFDTEGDPQKASNIALRIVEDQYTIGLVGPAFSGETKATGGVFDQAGLVSTTASATNVTQSENGWKTFFRGLANDGVQGPSVANYLEEHVGPQEDLCCRRQHRLRPGPVHRGARHARPSVADPACNISVKKGDKDFSAAVTQINSAAPESVFFGGYLRRGRPAGAAAQGRWLRRHLRQRRWQQGQRVRQAGRESSAGALLACPCGPATGTFAEEYTAKFNTEPGSCTAPRATTWAPSCSRASSSERSRGRHCWSSSATTRVRVLPANTSGPSRVNSPRPSSGSTRSSNH